MAITRTTDGNTSILRENQSSVDFEIDYTDLVARLATALESLADSTSSLAESTASIATNVETITQKISSIDTSMSTVASKISSMESHSSDIRNLAVGPGIHMISPYEWVGLASLYKMLIEQGQILNSGGAVSQEEQEKAFSRLSAYLSKISNLPTQF